MMGVEGVPGVSACQNYGRKLVPNVMGSGGVLNMMSGVGFQEWCWLLGSQMRCWEGLGSQML